MHLLLVRKQIVLVGLVRQHLAWELSLRGAIGLLLARFDDDTSLARGKVFSLDSGVGAVVDGHVGMR